MCLAIGMMLAWQLWSVAIGETAVESYDHEYYRKVASSRGEVCLNFNCLQTRLMPLVDLPELLRPWVRAFIADKTIIHPIPLLQEVK
jgi:hypothetical protein